MKDKIGDNARISHILEYIDEIEVATKGATTNTFANNHILRIAVVKWLEIIGEAANHITDETKSKNTGIEWGKIIGLRNIVVHEYFRIDYELIWDVVTNFLPQLKKEITAINL